MLECGVSLIAGIDHKHVTGISIGYCICSRIA